VVQKDDRTNIFSKKNKKENIAGSGGAKKFAE
jgi:hypothetical protein